MTHTDVLNRSDLAAWIERALPERLPAFLPGRRWFAGKARRILCVTFEDAAWLPSPRPCALVVVRVRDETADTRYSLLIGFARDPGILPVIGRVETAHETVCAVEAAAEPWAGLAVLRGFASAGRRTLPMLRGGALRYGDVDAAASRVLDGPSAVEPLGAEQSNSTLRIDRALAFKLFRRFEPGENPELEIGRFLATRTGFRDLPVLRGSLTYVSASAARSTLGVLQDWIESRGDGWSHVVGRLREQDGEAACNTLGADAFALGVITERCHRALAGGAGDPAFAPEAITAGDIALWRSAVVQRSRRIARLIGRQMAAWPAATRRLGEAFVERNRELAIMRLPDPHQAPFWKIRVHGDYHLGQTLKTDSGFVLIDFEGEPATPLADRRARQPALKDVAGMLRSFDYAVEAARGDLASAGVLRRGFLEGYRATFADSPPAFAPADWSAASAWIDALELEKALYEVEYEINNRPAWVHIPLRGLVRRLGGRTVRENDDA